MGLLHAFWILILWLFALATGLIFFKFEEHSFFISFITSIGLILFLTFLYTGLFITAHDAMHGSVIPHKPKLNRLVGRFFVALYAAFSFSHLLKKHKLHHEWPASQKDPDYHDGKNISFFSWYFRFIKRYVSFYQILIMAIVGESMMGLLHFNRLNVYLFWVLPALLSTLQLFYFGTYLPHQKPKGGDYLDSHRATSNDYPIWLSFITCYHFGYHWEHHQSPTTPWWKLPQLRKILLKNSQA